MNRVVLFLAVLSLGALPLPCRADWVVQQPGPPLPPPPPSYVAPVPAPHFTPPPPGFSAPAPHYAAAPEYVEGGCGCGCGEGDCGCSWSSPCRRPGLFARIRERLQSRRCEPCECRRPGLFERIRMRRAERRAGWCNPCCE